MSDPSGSAPRGTPLTRDALANVIAKAISPFFAVRAEDAYKISDAVLAAFPLREGAPRTTTIGEV